MNTRPPRPAATPAPSTRIEVIDALRGFAVFGLLVSHCYYLFFLGVPHVATLVDEVTGLVVRLFVSDKFYSLFSLLFGISFSLLLARSGGRAPMSRWRFAWRLGVLGLIGLLHNLHWNDDILSIYAVLGLLLIPVSLLRDRTVLILAAVMLLIVPNLTMEILQAPPPDEEVVERLEEDIGPYDSAREAWRSGTYAETVRVNVDTTTLKLQYYLYSGRFSLILGFFFLGLACGRQKLIHPVGENRDAFWRTFLWSTALSLALTLVALALMTGIGPLPAISSARLELLLNMQGIAMTLAYATGFSLLFAAARFQWLAKPFALVGRMALTNYVLHSVLGTVLLSGYGLGLLQHSLPATLTTLAAIPLFLAMVLFSRLWMASFRYGPLEWLWRMATYMERMPLRRGAPP